jgi:hypothetical protein
MVAAYLSPCYLIQQQATHMAGGFLKPFFSLGSCLLNPAGAADRFDRSGNRDPEILRDRWRERIVFFSSSNFGDDAEESLALLRRRMATGDFSMTTLQTLSRHIRMITPGGYCFLCLYMASMPWDTTATVISDSKMGCVVLKRASPSRTVPSKKMCATDSSLFF